MYIMYVYKQHGYIAKNYWSKWIYIQLVFACPGWLWFLLIFEWLFCRMGDVCEVRKKIIVEMKHEMDKMEMKLEEKQTRVKE